jgi:hypothetical protein
LLPDDFRDTAQGFFARIVQVVHRHHGVASLVEFNDGRSVEVSEDEFIWMGDS